jgi:hypothetical protein
MSDKETADNYDYIVVRLNDHWRVIDSHQPYPYRQWILQRHVRNSPANAWRSLSFCQTRAVLERDIGRRVGDIGEDAKTIVGALPERDLGHRERMAG